MDAFTYTRGTMRTEMNRIKLSCERRKKNHPKPVQSGEKLGPTYLPFRLRQVYMATAGQTEVFPAQHSSRAREKKHDLNNTANEK